MNDLRPVVKFVGLCLLDSVWRVCARLPWSRQSQHDAWRSGYMAGLKDGLSR